MSAKIIPVTFCSEFRCRFALQFWHSLQRVRSNCHQVSSPLPSWRVRLASPRPKPQPSGHNGFPVWPAPILKQLVCHQEPTHEHKLQWQGLSVTREIPGLRDCLPGPGVKAARLSVHTSSCVSSSHVCTSAWEAGGGCPPFPHLPPPPLQGKAIGDSFSTDQNSKTRIAGHLREKAGPSPDHIFLILKVRRPPWPHMRRKALEAKGQFCQGVLYPETFLVESMTEMCVHP